MNKIRITAVSYINTYPFLYLLKRLNSPLFDLTVDYPAECARKLVADKADIGLIPVATLGNIPNGKIITDYCIGADGAVNTVALLSNSPIEDIDTIYLDYQSRTSVNLMKLLAREYFNKEFIWVDTKPGFENYNLKDNEGMVVIGDRVFVTESRFSYKYDLPEEWKKHTGLPFIFAAWITNKDIPQPFIDTLNNCFKDINQSFEKSVETFHKDSAIDNNTVLNYLKNDIVYRKTSDMEYAMHLFITKLAQNNILI
jgi:chorismate dehydratase